MIILVNGGMNETGLHENGFGRLLSPRSGNSVSGLVPWAADNDAFLAWDEGRFVAMMDRPCFHAHRDRCLFVTAPDVVGDAGETQKRFWHWREEIVMRGFPVAYVIQDGEREENIPWPYIDSVFIGGSTEWKLSLNVELICGSAKKKGKWVHMGRVNSHKRFRHACEIGCDSIDGTGFSMFPDIYSKKGIRWTKLASSQPTLKGF